MKGVPGLVCIKSILTIMRCVLKLEWTVHMNSAEIESSERILRDMSKSAVLDQNHVNGVARTAQLML